MNINPLLTGCSLLISTYNWPEALSSCLYSVMQQSMLPNEIIIADDGSKAETSDLIQEWKQRSSVPIIHVWHPDEGFRLSTIRNLAISRAGYSYIIQIDGDILLHRRFIADHLQSSMNGVFLCGSRVAMPEELSTTLLKSNSKIPRLSQIPSGYLLNSLRIPFLSRIMANYFYKNTLKKLRGCNMSFWKEDLMRVNGYNEDITGWGLEDSEIAVRLINAGVEKRILKFKAIAFHLFHNESNKTNPDKNINWLDAAIKSNIKWAENGIVKRKL